jgi:pyruvate kinase
MEWHTKISKRIKKICPESFVLLDIPGLKPRTNNLKDIQIKKNQMVKFVFGKQDDEEGVLSIETTKPLPNIKNIVKEFSISDGLFKFQYIKNKNNYIQGISKNTFKLKPKKGLNIPNSFYDDTLQEKMYLEFIKKAKEVQFDGIGLSFIQNGEILRKIRNILKDKFLVSKIENLYGLNNASEISKNSDLIMIDRGDLLAEVGESNFYKAICEISTHAHRFKKPLIMATENLESMQKRLQPSKSEIISLEHSINLGSDIIMLSDETATSPLFMNTLEWLYNFLKQ